MFRVCRRCFIAGLLLGCLLLLWLHWVGLPGPLSALVKRELRQAGWAADYARVRLRFDRGLVAEDLSLTRSGQGGFRLHVEEVALVPDWGRLWHGDFEVVGLNVLSGRLTVPLEPLSTPGSAAANHDVEPLVLDDLAGRLRLLAEDEWELADGRAHLFGCDVRLDGRVAHLASLNRFRPPPPAGVSTGVPPAEPPLRAQLRQFTSLWRTLDLDPTPELRVWLRGDATRPSDFLAEVSFAAPSALTPWGEARGLHFVAQLNAAAPTNQTYHLRLRFQADRLHNSTFELARGRVTADLAQPATNPVPARVLWHGEAGLVRWRDTTLNDLAFTATTERLDDRFRRWQADFTVDAAGLRRPELSTGTNHFAGEVTVNLDQWSQTRARLDARAADLRATDWGHVASAEAALKLAPAANGSAPSPPPTWGFWTNAAPWTGTLGLRVRGVDSPRLVADALELNVEWTPPELRVPRLFARLYGGVIDLNDARLNVASRELTARLATTCDVHRLDGVLPPDTVKWLAQFSWEAPPVTRAQARVVLPPWVGPAPDPRTHLLPTVVVDGHVEGRHAGYRGVPFDHAELDVGLKDGVLRLRNFHLARPEGDADLAYTLEIVPRNFRWQLDARLNPVEVAPAIGRNVVKIFGLFDFTNAAHVRGDVMGCFRPPRRTDLDLQIEARDFTFRGERYDALTGHLVGTNRVLTAIDARVRHGNEWARVARLDYSIDRRELTLTNAHTRMDPMRVARALGPAVEQVLAPYRFGRVPEIRLGGFVPTDGDTARARMWFDVRGKPFQFWRFNFEDVAGQVHWLGDTVLVTNFNGGFYQGRLTGNLAARITRERGPNLAFDAAVTNANLRPIVRDVFAVTNQLAGVLSGHVVVTNGIPDTIETWFGHGDLALRDGLIWDLPVFGVISKALNAISPGLGNNQATAARGHYTLTKGVLYSDDFKIETGGARLAYEGSCSLSGETDARVQVELLRGAPVVGPLVSFLFTPFAKVLELQVTGPLSDPRVQFLNMSPLGTPFKDPFGTFKRIFQPRVVPPKSPAGSPPSNP